MFTKECPSWNKGLTKNTDERVKKQAEKAKGRIFTKEQRVSIGAGVKKALAKIEVRNKMKKPKTEVHKKSLSLALVGNECAKGSIRTEAYRRAVGVQMKGNTYRRGKLSSDETKAKNKKASERNWANPEYREKRKNALHKHHIYLDGDDTKTLMLTSSKHLQLHSRAYEYLVETKEIDNYIKWFDKKYGGLFNNKEEMI